ncbi:hypothetical protein EDC56_2569 [Sinobacterium caligoides]|uniref:Uncharacterized protein n=1 Tax=Sinobacterium caligoides TaxID=933926 RepID=A0A3N2DKS1_9GAMM|nr:hypothetical protein [Sinobacterium caligoides]ROR99934.1 hypothetical protein EDC56_2569 [Sinobacterium caligoides]
MVHDIKIVCKGCHDKYSCFVFGQFDSEISYQAHCPKCHTADTFQASQGFMRTLPADNSVQAEPLLEA